MQWTLEQMRYFEAAVAAGSFSGAARRLGRAQSVVSTSIGLLDTPWPKVLRTKAQFSSLLCLGAPEDAYFEMLADTTCAPDLRLPETGVPLDVERMLSAVCIETPGYGTRTSTVVKLYSDAPPELHERVLQPLDTTS